LAVPVGRPINGELPNPAYAFGLAYLAALTFLAPPGGAHQSLSLSSSSSSVKQNVRLDSRGFGTRIHQVDDSKNLWEQRKNFCACPATNQPG
jgi:hypothetical protein